MRLCALHAAERGERGDDLRGPCGELLITQGVGGGLEDDAHEHRVDAGSFLRVAPDFDGAKALQLGECE